MATRRVLDSCLRQVSLVASVGGRRVILRTVSCLHDHHRAICSWAQLQDDHLPLRWSGRQWAARVVFIAGAFYVRREPCAKPN